MTSEIVVALLSFAGTLFGSVAGIMAANKLTIYRVEQLEKKVDKHNNLIDRMYKAETRLGIIENDISDIKQSLGH